MTVPLRVAIVGAGPAGSYAADALLRSGVADVRVDLFERLPAPFGLIRYGVAPDHPRIKRVVTALCQVLENPEIRLIGNVEYGTDFDLDTLRWLYDAVIFATGADADRTLDLPGVGLDGSYGAAEFVSWYDGHPDSPRTWPLGASRIAVLGAGNVALDVARMLMKTADEQLVTDIPDNVYTGLAANKAAEVRVFGRRGPAQAKFTPLELRELDESQTFDVAVPPADISYDDGSRAQRRDSKIVDQVAGILETYAERTSESAPRKLFLHFFENPVEILGQDGRVCGLRTERTELNGNGTVRGTGLFRDWGCEAVYRAVGYRSQKLPGLPFDDGASVIPNAAGRVANMPGVYCTGWIKRGPVGLIGHTKRDANETVAALVEDYAADRLIRPPDTGRAAITDHLQRHRVSYTTWEDWLRLDAYERDLGAARGRDRIKVVDRRDMLAAGQA